MDDQKVCNWCVTLYDIYYHAVDSFDVYNKTEKQADEEIRIKVSSMHDIEDWKMEEIKV